MDVLGQVSGAELDQRLSLEGGKEHKAERSGRAERLWPGDALRAPLCGLERTITTGKDCHCWKGQSLLEMTITAGKGHPITAGDDHRCWR